MLLLSLTDGQQLVAGANAMTVKELINTKVKVTALASSQVIRHKIKSVSLCKGHGKQLRNGYIE